MEASRSTRRGLTWLAALLLATLAILAWRAAGIPEERQAPTSEREESAAPGPKHLDDDPSRAPAPVQTASSTPALAPPPPAPSWGYRILVEGPSGEPIPEADVVLAPETGAGESVRGSTDVEGRVVLRSAHAGPCTAQASRGDLYGRRGNVLGEQEVTVRVESLGEVRFLAQDERGAAVPGVSILVVAGRAGVERVITGADGVSPACRIPRGAPLNIAAAGKDFARAHLEIPSEEVRELVTLTLVRASQPLTGVVLHDGRPVEGARVRDLERGEHVAVTDAQGSFDLGRYGNQDEVLLLASREGLAYATAAVSIAGGPAYVRLELPAGGTLEVTVVDPHDRPVPDVELTGTAHTGWSRTPSDPPVEFDARFVGRTGPDGRCVLSGLQGGAIDLVARHPEHAVAYQRVERATRTTLRLSPRHDWTWSVLAVEEVARVFGREGWSITLTPRAAPDSDSRLSVPDVRWFGVTDRNGRAFLRSIPEGRYDAHVEGPRYAWLEDLAVDVVGEEGRYDAPGTLVRLQRVEEERAPLAIHGPGYRSNFVRFDGGFAGLGRSGAVELQRDGRLEAVVLPPGAGVHWLDTKSKEVRR